MNPWIRLYRESIHNPKIVTLNDRQHRAWHNCLLVADDAGELPKFRDIACHMRMTLQEAEQIVCELVEVGLVDIIGTGPDRKFRMHDWNVHQYVSDNSTERVKKFRSKNKETITETTVKRFSNGVVTPPEAEAESEADTEFSLSTRETFVSRFGLSKASRGVPPRLRAKVEGLGLPVDDLIARAMAPDVKSPSALFRHLAVEALHRMLPRADKRMLASALTKDGDQTYGIVCKMILEAAQ